MDEHNEIDVVQADVQAGAGFKANLPGVGLVTAHPMNDVSAGILLQLLSNEASAKTALDAASLARQATVASTAAAMGLGEMEVFVGGDGKPYFVERAALSQSATPQGRTE